jgi:hypothetical protein
LDDTPKGVVADPLAKVQLCTVNWTEKTVIIDGEQNALFDYIAEQ